jgi:CheY-like chemotaxis protein
VNEQKGKPVFEGDVLLCEDNKMNQDLIRDRLTRAGLKTTVVENGKKGVELVVSRKHDGKKPFDLIFMDIYMPVMDGFEAAAEIGKLKTGTPIIAISANDNPTERDHYAARGMSDCMNKPFTSQELSVCLMKYLKPMTDEAASRNADTARSRQDADIRSEEKLKIRLINNFLKNNKTVYHKITKAIDEGDIKLAHRFAHTLKSNAGILGKKRLQKAAEDVESLLANEENRMNQAALIIFKTELDAVLEELAPFTVESAFSAGKEGDGTLRKEEIEDLLDELEALLDGGSTECLNLIGSLRLLPQSALPSAGKLMVGELIHQIEYFEFDGAMETLARLKKNMAETGHE